ncbi:recombinase family protein [Streptomyces sp. NPDC086783]|uniref:recombinase family protein n=1 Tax=Streptomyces sp. NPDC086783 TaxID=3365758 RepID=UPI0038144F39
MSVPTFRPMTTPFKTIDPSGDLDIYARKSVARKGKRDTELSVGQQIEDGIRWAKWNGYTPRHVWVDHGISGSKDVKRPAYDAGLNALETGEIKCLWSYKLDRFSRRGALAVLTIMERLEGRRIFFGADNLDTSEPKDRRMIMWRAEDAKEFSDQLSDRVSDSWRYSKDQGYWLAPRVPYGLKKTKTRKLVPDDTPAIPGKAEGPTKADVIRRIVSEIAEGATAPTVADGLNAEGIPCPSGGKWSPQYMYRVVKNPAYIGLQPSSKWFDRDDPIHRNAEGRRVSVGKALVTEAQQMRARKAVKGRTKLMGDKSSPARRGVRSMPKHLLSGLLHCAGCGRKMVRRGMSYNCPHKTSGGRPCDAPASVMAKYAHDFVFAAFVNRLTMSEPDDALILAVATRWLAANRPDAVSERKELAEAVENAKAELSDLLDARYKRGEFSGPAAEYFPGLLAEAEDKVRLAEKALSAVPEPTADVSFLFDAEQIQEAWQAATEEQRRGLLALALDGICVRRKFGAGRTKVTAERFHYAWAGFTRVVDLPNTAQRKAEARTGA